MDKLSCCKLEYYSSSNTCHQFTEEAELSKLPFLFFSHPVFTQTLPRSPFLLFGDYFRQIPRHRYFHITEQSYPGILKAPM